jgi:hypothetical protein
MENVHSNCEVRRRKTWFGFARTTPLKLFCNDIFVGALREGEHLSFSLPSSTAAIRVELPEVIQEPCVDTCRGPRPIPRVRHEKLAGTDSP